MSLNRTITPRLRWGSGAAAFVVLSLAITYPLVTDMAHLVPHDLGDPLLNSWILWWSTARLPLSNAWWNAAMFFPATDVTTYSEVLLGLLPITAPVQWATGSALTSYNTAFLLSFPLCALAAYALAFQLTQSHSAATVAGLAYGFPVYKANELAHIQMLAYYGAPMALFALHRFVESRRQRWLVLFACAWLVQALSNGNAMFHLAILVALWLAWFVADLKTLLPIGVAWLMASLPLVPILARYQAVHQRMHFSRDINEIVANSADVSALFAAPPENVLWGGSLLSVNPGTALFPGVAVSAALAVIALAWWQRRPERRRRLSTARKGAIALALAIAGVAASVVILGPWQIPGVLTVTALHKPFAIAAGLGLVLLLTSNWIRDARRARSIVAFYVLAAGAMYLLALGPRPTAWGHQFLYEPPYAWLMRLPGFGTLRAPARFAMLAVLCQSLVVAVSLARWRVGGRVRFAAVTVLAIGIVADGWFTLPLPVTPDARVVRWNDVDAVLELPFGDPGADFISLYRAIGSTAATVNGYSGYFPPHYLPLTFALRDRQFSALREVAHYGNLGVILPRSSEHLAERAWLEANALTVDQGQDGWIAFRMPRETRPDPGPLTPVPVRAVAATEHGEDAGRMIDGEISTAWSSVGQQNGDEEVVVELEEPQPVSSVVLSMGPLSFGFPRQLEVSTSADGQDWQIQWRGTTSLQTVRAALLTPERVPVVIDFAPTPARWIRLRQLGTEHQIPWWIAELEVARR